MQALLAQSDIESSLLWRAAELFLLRGGYNAAVVQIGTALLGVAAASVGTFAMLRKRSLMGDALAHSTLPGIAIAFLAAPLVHVEPRSLPWLLTGAAGFGILGVLFVQFLARSPRITEDTAMAVVLSSLFGLGFVLLSYIQTMPTGNQAGLKSLILGQAAAMRISDARIMAVLAIISILALSTLLKELRLICFDRDYACVQGWPVAILDLALMALVVLVTVIGLQAVGIVLIVALLIVPAATARLWSDRLGHILVISAIIGALAGYTGSIISALFPNTATGGAIVLVAGVCFGVSLLIAPRRGVLSSGLHFLTLRTRIARDHALRHAHEWLDKHDHPVEANTVFPTHILARHPYSFTGRIVIHQLRKRRLIRLRDKQSVLLTKDGAAMARRITYAHRLWERYLLQRAQLNPSHVHTPADLVEHTLDDTLIAELEQALAGDSES